MVAASRVEEGVVASSREEERSVTLSMEAEPLMAGLTASTLRVLATTLLWLLGCPSRLADLEPRPVHWRNPAPHS